MSSVRKRACLQHGPKLDLNYLFRQGYIREGRPTGPAVLEWTDSNTGAVLRSGYLSARFRDAKQGLVRVETESLDQTIMLVSSARYFGGRQGYFVCPATSSRAASFGAPRAQIASAPRGVA